jgi:hypothetical protein
MSYSAELKLHLERVDKLEFNVLKFHHGTMQTLVTVLTAFAVTSVYCSTNVVAIRMHREIL